MSHHSALSLPELAARYKISDLCGASVAYFSSDEAGVHDLRNFTNRISCYELQLICQGNAWMKIAGQTQLLKPGDLLIMTPFQSADCYFPDGLVTEGLLIDSQFYEQVRVRDQSLDMPLSEVPQTSNMIWHLDEHRRTEFSGLLQQIRKSIQTEHLYKMEMIRSLVHVCLLFVSDLPFEARSLGADVRHKENIFKIFLHLAVNNFREQRQIQFYADKLCISSTYLSRVVKEVSGNTVGDHLALLTYNEACNLLLHSDKTVGEISFELHFHDQPAFTNFFKQHSGTTPLRFKRNHQK
ncbi:MAG: helix-turn-helix domain-containing protein [Prevotella sp.]|jgi:AraC family transcriptional activator of pobA